MLTLAVWIFDSPETAPRVAARLRDVDRPGDAATLETAVVTWQSTCRRPDIDAYGDAQHDLLERPFWALVLSQVFSLPLLGAELAQPTGGSAAALSATGLSETFTNRLRDEVVPGTSALFALLPAADLPFLPLNLEERRSTALTAEIAAMRETAFLELFCT